MSESTPPAAAASITPKTILVTGGAGFVGSHLCERLARDGHTVISLDNYFTGRRENHVEGVDYREGHTKDIEAHIPETPDLIFHLGEYARTEKSFEDILEVWDLNKLGTFAVLEFCRRKKCRLVYAGSSTKFADQGDGRDQSPYAWTKATNTELVNNYARWFDIDYAITYFYNVYGPREMAGPFGTVIRIFTELYRSGLPFTVTAPGTQTRNYTHVYDIVDGLVLVGEKGQGDGHGLGAPTAYSVFDLVEMFGSEHMMLPERPGNRTSGGVESEKSRALGWEPRHTLKSYIEKTIADITATKTTEARILVFSTTFYPHNGPAEDALCDLMKAMPNIQFDVVTTKFSKDAMGDECPIENATVHRVGYGYTFDKYLLPILGRSVAKRLQGEHSYIFKWSLFASYGALTALFTKGRSKTPLLITLGDQKLGSIPWYMRALLRMILGSADLVYASDTTQERAAATLSKRTTLTRSIGQGDVFANQVRFVYSNFLRERLEKCNKK